MGTRGKTQIPQKTLHIEDNVAHWGVAHWVLPVYTSNSTEFKFLGRNSELELCKVIPHHPYSNWNCEWSDSGKIRICQKICVQNFQLSSGPTQLKCHVKNGWINKQMAQCELKTSQSCEINEKPNHIQQLSFEMITCSK